jgi:hypothetical protein
VSNQPFIPELWSKQFLQDIHNDTLVIRSLVDAMDTNRPIGKAWKPTTPEDEEIDALLNIAGVTATPVPPAKGLPARWRLHLTRDGYHTKTYRITTIADWRAAISELLNNAAMHSDWVFDAKTGERLK